jgi:hypothetical protein
MEDLFGDNENDCANEARITLATKARGKKYCKPNEPIEKKIRLTWSIAPIMANIRCLRQ